MPPNRVLIEISDDEDETYVYSDPDGFDDDESETSSETSINEDVGSNEQDSCDETSSSGSENSDSDSDSDSDDPDLDQEVVALQYGILESSDDGQEEEEDSPEPGERTKGPSRQRLPIGDETLADDTAELRRSLEALETEEALRAYYPCEFWASNPIPYVDEGSTLDDLMSIEVNHAKMEMNSAGDKEEDWPDCELHQFYVYRSRRHPQGFQGQYAPLHLVTSREPDQHKHHWVFSGVVKVQNQERPISGYVRGVSIGKEVFKTCTTAGVIWIKSEVGQKKKCWYHLKEPHPGYKKLWDEFLWLSDFATLFFDYLKESSKHGKLVTLMDFKSDFWSQLQKWHGKALDHWAQQRAPKQVGKPIDLRQDVAQYKAFLQYLVTYTPGGDAERHHPVWEEVCAFNKEHDKQATSQTEDTVVTKNVAACFHETFPRWKNEFQLLKVIKMSTEVEKFREIRRRHWGFPDKLSGDQNTDFLIDPISRTKLSLVDRILEHAGTQLSSKNFRHANDIMNKIVIVRVDDEEFCYAWVRKIVTSTKVAVVWLVRPCETLCGAGFYPRGNELFFSKRCNCEPVSIRNVVVAMDASIFCGQAKDGAKIFVHGLFDQTKKAHLTANEANVVCHCQDERCRSHKKNLHDDYRTFTPRKLKGLSLFAGAGLLAWSMERTGYTQTITAIEQSKIAAASFKANDEFNKVDVLNESVNVVLKRKASSTTSPEDYDLIDAGPPCRSFSNLNAHPDSENSQRQATLLANTLSWFELYLPVYGVIENVPQMDSGSPNACEQAICMFVALGYQVRKMKVIASRLGGASSRKRLIILVAAPQAELPDEIKDTHGDEDEYGLRRIRTSKEVISGLAPITNDTILKISDPRHVPLCRFGIDFVKGVNLRNVIERIPCEPPGFGLAQTANMALLSRSQQTWFSGLTAFQKDPKMRTLKRINENKPFHTLATQIVPMDAKHSGLFLHYQQHRALSAREACLAMDVPAGFIIVGTPKQQYKQVGNGVAGIVGATIARTIGKSWISTVIKSPWLENLPRENGTASGPVIGLPTSTALLSDNVRRTTSLRPIAPLNNRRAAPVLATSPTAPMVPKKETHGRYDGSALRTVGKRARPPYPDEEDSDLEFISSNPVQKQDYKRRREV